MTSSHTPNSSKDRKNASESLLSQFVQKVELTTGLYVVATPIGNLRDVTLRALDTLNSVDAVYAEDTRQTRRLLDAYGLRPTLRTYHDHNGARMRPQILEGLQNGERIALVSDAGTPLISDPGFKLVRDVRDAGFPVIPLPGPSALTAALSASGLPTDTFTFAGFLPVKSKARQTRLAEFKSDQTTLILYETGNRLSDTLADIVSVLGDIELVLARELTKLFETITNSTASALLAEISENGPPKGEIVLLLSIAGKDESHSAADIEAFLIENMPAQGTKAAANMAAEAFKMPKRDMYNLAMQIKSRAGHDE